MSRFRSPSATEQVADTAGDAAVEAAQALRARASATAEALAPRAEAARDTVVSSAESAWHALGPRLAAVRDTAAPAVGTAAATVAGAAVGAGEALAPRLASAREQALPMARERSESALATLRTYRPPEQGRRRWPVVLGFLAIGAGIGMARGAMNKRTSAEPQRVQTPGSQTAVPPPPESQPPASQSPAAELAAAGLSAPSLAADTAPATGLDPAGPVEPAADTEPRGLTAPDVQRPAGR